MAPRRGGTPRWAKRVSAWVLYSAFLISLAGCEDKPKAKLTPPPSPAVTVAQPVRGRVTDYLESTGNTQAVITVQLFARVAGYLEKVFFKDGQVVKKNQLLFLIQKNTYQDALRQAEGAILLQKAQLDYAQTQLERYSNLLQQKAAAQSDVDNWRYQRDSARANLVTAEANRDLAKLNLEYTEVRAPFSGRIDRRLVDPGNLVGSPQPTVLAQLTQIDPIYVYFTISDLDLARLTEESHWKPSQAQAKTWPVYVGLPNENGYPHQGRLDFAATSLTPTTGTLLMRAIFSNPDGKILPGLYARVHVPMKEKEAFLIPEVAIGSDQQGSYVFTVNEKNIVERRSVKTGPVVGELRAIEGLEGKEWVIVKGLLKAAPGRQVTPEREGLEPPPGPSSLSSPPPKKAGP
jgi:RND family efflux transporter MFP subunit